MTDNEPTFAQRQRCGVLWASTDHTVTADAARGTDRIDASMPFGLEAEGN